MEITLGSLFDGISGFPLAGQRNDMQAIWASEIEPFPMKVSTIRFPGMEQKGDITKLNGAELEPVDIITGGSPCQDLSVAGKRAGLAGKRSGLFMEQVRIIREMREHEKQLCRTTFVVRPRFMVWENVPGAFSSNKGEDFRAVLEETARVADETVVIPGPPKGKWSTVGCIMGDGWSIAWRILDAQYWGVPQRRRRIFLVADFGGQSAPEILFKRKGLRRHLAEGREAREEIAADVERSFNAASWDCRGKGNGTVAGTIKGGQDRVTDYTSIVIPINDKATRHMGGGASRSHDGSGNGLGVGKPGDPCPTLTAGDKHAVCAGFNGFKSVSGSIQYQEDRAATLEANMPGNVIAVNQNASGEVRQGEVANTLNTNSNASGRNAPLIAQINCQPSGTAGTVSSKWAKGTGGPARDECYNLVCSVDCRNMYENDEKSGTLQSKPNGGQSLNYTNPVRQGYSVRRLTPLECDRLQDFPDNWTNIQWQETTKKGKTKTVKAKDSPRYKATGNSIAVCCAEYVLEGIKEAINQ